MHDICDIVDLLLLVRLVELLLGVCVIPYYLVLDDLWS